MSGANVDSTFMALGGSSRYQLLQALAINLGAMGAAYQLLDNIFIGRKVTGHQCAPPTSGSEIAAHLQDVSWNSSSQVTYGKCEITVLKDNQVNSYPCLFGYEYDYPRELSFRTEFDLVCGQALLADFLQTLVIFGQGCGAVLASMLSDRYGRKQVLVLSQVGLLLVGMWIGMAPSFAWLAFLKFCIGCLQQGVVTGKATMCIELYPSQYRSVASLVLSLMWLVSIITLTAAAYLLQYHSWRYLQCVLSAVSLLAFVQMWYLDESLRWLVANGKKEAVVRVLERAARVNGKDLKVVLATLHDTWDTSEFSERSPMLSDELAKPDTSIEEIRKRTKGLDEGFELISPVQGGIPIQDSCTHLGPVVTAGQKPVQKLTFWDVFRHRRLCFNTSVIWVTWFTCAFCTFTLFMMSTSLHGSRFLNFCLTASAELPAGLLFYYIVDRAGRKPAIQLFLLLSGLGLVCSGFFRMFEDNKVFELLSVATAMLGMMGSTGIFGAMFFYTPELYPTNIRQQAIGFASFAGRCGGMIAPFMVPLSELIVWLPGAISGTLCFLVILLFRFLPETQGRQLPQTLEDIDDWDENERRTECAAVSAHCAMSCVRRCARLIKKFFQRFCNSFVGPPGNF